MRRFARVGKVTTGLLLLALVSIARAVLAGSSPAPPDLLLLNGRIFTGQSARPYVQALAIRGERVVATGDSERIKALGVSRTRQIDLHGRTVIPGINDAHNHLGVDPPRLSALKFTGADPTWAEIRAALAAAVAETSKDTFLVGVIGLTAFGDLQVDRDSLDKVAPNHPVFLVTFTGHGMILNSAALTAAKIGENQQDPLGGRFERLPGGRLSGVAREYAARLVDRRIMNFASEDDAVSQLRQTLLAAARFGITSIQDMSDSMPPERAVALLQKVPTPLRVRIIR